MNVSILTWNINGLTDLKYVEHQYSVLFQQHDLVLFQKTNSKYIDPSFFPGFQLFHTQVPMHTHKRGHGLVIAVKENTVFCAQLWAKTSSTLWVCLRFKDESHPPLYVGNVYIPPAGSPLLRQISLDVRFGEIDGVLHGLDGQAQVFMGGDFNAHVEYASSSHDMTHGRYIGQNSAGRKLVCIHHQSYMSMCTGGVVGDIPPRPTYRATTRSSATRPDHILVSNTLRDKLISIKVDSELRGSDHFPLVAKIHIVIPRSTRPTLPQEIMRIVNWNGRYRLPFIEALEGARPRLDRCAFMAREGNIDLAMTEFHDILLSSARDAGMALQSKETKERGYSNRPFFNKDCQLLKREWRVAGRKHGYQSQLVKSLERKYHSYVRSRKRAWLLSNLQECISMFHSNPRRFWQTFRGKTMALPKPLQTHDAWEQFLQCMVRSEPIHLTLEPSRLSLIAYPCVKEDASHLGNPFSIQEVEEGLMALHTGKSNGFIGYPSEFLRFAQRPRESNGRYHPHLLAPVVTELINGMFTSGQIPRGYNVLKVTPVVKDEKKNILDTSNYRPIGVPEPLMRLYATLLNGRLVEHIEGIGYRCEAQVGFRPEFSTLHQLLTLQHFIDRATPDEPLYCCKVDLSKAYDKVPRTLLWEALRRTGIEGRFLEAIKSVYDDAEITLSVGGTYGEHHKVASGITQGSPLSPSLFGIYSDGLIRHIEETCPNTGPCTRDGRHVPILGFADDFKLLARSPEELSILLKVTSQWCDMARMEVSPTKTHIVVFPECARKRLGGPITYDGIPLEVVTQSRHLGVTFSSRAGMGETFANLHGKMWGAWYAILGKYGNLRCTASIGLLLKVFLTCVVPTGSYACELWGWHKLSKSTSGVTRNDLEKDFLSMIRMIVGVRSTVRSDILLNEFGIRPLKYQWLKRMVSLWNKLVALPENHLYSRILRDSCFYGVTTHSPSWAGSFMVAMRSIGYPYPIDCRTPHPIDMDTFRALLSRVHSTQEVGLHISPRLAPREPVLCTYLRWFGRPSSIQRIRLMSLSLDIRKVRTFFRFRLGVHDLPIDMGRRNKVPRDERTCDMCGLAVGDEHHFIFHCSALTSLRTRYARLFSSQSYNLRRFIWQEDIVAVVNFVYEGFQVRSQIQRARRLGLSLS